MRAAAWAIAFLACAFAGELPAARVVQVSDGDSITVVEQGREQRIRLWGIDAPERGQPWSRVSRDSLARRALHREASIEDRGPDGWGRMLARVRVDGVDLGEAQVADGMAWVFRRYTADPALVALEDNARRERRGLWKQAAPEAPWIWRERQRATNGSAKP
jgi:micrococcal nuclease